MNIDATAARVFETAYGFLYNLNTTVGNTLDPRLLREGEEVLQAFDRFFDPHFLNLFKTEETILSGDTEVQKMIPYEDYLTEILKIGDQESVQNIAKYTAGVIDAVGEQLRFLRDTALPAARKNIQKRQWKAIEPFVKQAWMANEIHVRKLNEIRRENPKMKDEEVWKRAIEESKGIVLNEEAIEWRELADRYQNIVDFFVNMGGKTEASHSILNRLLNRALNERTNEGVLTNLHQFLMRAGFGTLHQSPNPVVKYLLFMGGKTMDAVEKARLGVRSEIRKLEADLFGSQISLTSKDYRGRYSFMINEDPETFHPTLAREWDWDRFNDFRKNEFDRVAKETRIEVKPLYGADIKMNDQYLQRQIEKAQDRWVQEHTELIPELRPTEEEKKQNEKPKYDSYGYPVFSKWERRLSDWRVSRIREKMESALEWGVIPDEEAPAMEQWLAGIEEKGIREWVERAENSLFTATEEIWNQFPFLIESHPTLYRVAMAAINEVRHFEERVPKDPQFKDPKYGEIMKDPKKKAFYEQCVEIQRMYDLSVPDSKKLGNNLPSVMAEADEANLPFLTRIGMRLWGGKKRAFEEYKRKQRERGATELDMESGMKTATGEAITRVVVPLPHSGYEPYMTPANRSYNLAKAYDAVWEDLVHYNLVGSQAPLWEILIDHYKRNEKGSDQDWIYNQLLDLLNASLGMGTHGNEFLKGTGVPGQILSSVRFLGNAVTFLVVGAPMTQYLLHFLSEFSIASKAVGHDIGMWDYTKAHATSVWNILRGRTPYTDFLGLSDYKKMRMGDYREGLLGNVKSLNEGLQKLLYAGYSISDHWIKEMYSDALLSSTDVFDIKMKKIGSLKDNLTRNGKTGKLEIGDHVYYWVSDIHKPIPQRIDGNTVLQLKDRANVMLAATLSAQIPLYRTFYGMGVGRLERLMTIVGRSIGLLSTEMDLHPDYYDLFSSRMNRVQGTRAFARAFERAMEYRNIQKIAGELDPGEKINYSKENKYPIFILMYIVGSILLFGLMRDWINSDAKKRKEIDELVQWEDDQDVNMRNKEIEKWNNEVDLDRSEHYGKHLVKGLLSMVLKAGIQSFSPLELASTLSCGNLSTVLNPVKNIPKLPIDLYAAAVKQSNGDESNLKLFFKTTLGMDNPYYRADTEGGGTVRDRTNVYMDPYGADKETPYSRTQWILNVDNISPYAGMALRAARAATGKGKGNAGEYDPELLKFWKNAKDVLTGSFVTEMDRVDKERESHAFLDNLLRISERK